MKQTLIILFLLIGMQQTGTAKIKIAPEGGLNFALYSYRDYYYTQTSMGYYSYTDKYEYRYKTLAADYRVGCNFEVALSKHFFLQPAVFFLKSRYEWYRFIDDGYVSGSGSTRKFDTILYKTAVYSLNVPAYLVYKLNVGKKCMIALAGGPYIDLNMGGKTTFDGLDLKIALTIGGNSGAITRFEAGAGGFAAFQLQNGIYFKAGYQAAFNDLIPNQGNSMVGSLHHSSMGITAGYFLGTNKRKAGSISNK